jgi:hypothetical protein
MPHRRPLAWALRTEYGISADELAGRPRLVLMQRVEESPDFTEQGDC